MGKDLKTVNGVDESLRAFEMYVRARGEKRRADLINSLMGISWSSRAVIISCLASEIDLEEALQEVDRAEITRELLKMQEEIGMLLKRVETKN